ncbi:uncharacterized protein BDW43DRAFT_309149 [Aspergillus alliaceus]|uniref:uncharacterized protein n=1 Tax=Petromyces alliaceus TaxID=209559 RepID=UPI0012A6730D|nr:uncharacterized protein BDW43DRAFT_309149 [Aspergillus alliaceus]KAB8235819.1 hypothetical protein BDW43DRAFT_309149 [Aspergillus alliaceus]
MSFTKNLTRALNTQPLTQPLRRQQQQRTLTYATNSHESLEYRLSKLSLSKIKQESARPEPDLRHVVGYASVNRAVGDKMYQNLVRGVETLRTERKERAERWRNRMASSSSSSTSLSSSGSGAPGVRKGNAEEVGEMRCVEGRKRKARSRGLREEVSGWI